MHGDQGTNGRPNRVDPSESRPPRQVPDHYRMCGPESRRRERVKGEQRSIRGVDKNPFINSILYLDWILLTNDTLPNPTHNTTRHDDKLGHPAPLCR